MAVACQQMQQCTNKGHEEEDCKLINTDVNNDRFNICDRLAFWFRLSTLVFTVCCVPGSVTSEQVHDTEVENCCFRGQVANVFRVQLVKRHLVTSGHKGHSWGVFWCSVWAAVRLNRVEIHVVDTRSDHVIKTINVFNKRWVFPHSHWMETLA